MQATSHRGPYHWHDYNDDVRRRPDGAWGDFSLPLSSERLSKFSLWNCFITVNRLSLRSWFLHGREISSDHAPRDSHRHYSNAHVILSKHVYFWILLEFVEWKSIFCFTVLTGWIECDSCRISLTSFKDIPTGTSPTFEGSRFRFTSDSLQRRSFSVRNSEQYSHSHRLWRH